ncbi:hypothetical protein [Maricaulis sp.]|uniref:hypothetical protein n=1 Tax=Maricaulis sp. TaxID=1486257 RepID=UPI003A8F13E5
MTLILSGRSHFDLVSGILDGRYRAIAGLNPLIEWGSRIVGYLLLIGIPTFVASRFSVVSKAWSSLLPAMIIGLFLAVVAFVIVRAGYPLVAPLIGHDLQAVTTSVWLELIIVGLVWGTVFWLRAPKPQTAGIAA